MASAWDVGDSVTAHVLWTKGGIGTAATTTLSVKKPDGTLVTPAPTVTAMTQPVLDDINADRAVAGLPALTGLTGRYYAILSFDQHGPWHLRWVAGTPVNQAEEGTVIVRRSKVLA